jgi:hypothetical protein
MSPPELTAHKILFVPILLSVFLAPPCVCVPYVFLLPQPEKYANITVAYNNDPF